MAVTPSSAKTECHGCGVYSEREISVQNSLCILAATAERDITHRRTTHERVLHSVPLQATGLELRLGVAARMIQTCIGLPGCGVLCDCRQGGVQEESRRGCMVARSLSPWGKSLDSNPVGSYRMSGEPQAWVCHGRFGFSVITRTS